MAIYEIASRNLANLEKARADVRSYQTVWYRPGRPVFYMRLSRKHVSVARNLERQHGVSVREVDEVPPEFLAQVEEQDHAEERELLDELPVPVLLEALERRLWYMREEARERQTKKEEETEAGLGRVNAAYDPQIARKEGQIREITAVIERLRAAVNP